MFNELYYRHPDRACHQRVWDSRLQAHARHAIPGASNAHITGEQVHTKPGFRRPHLEDREFFRQLRYATRDLRGDGIEDPGPVQIVGNCVEELVWGPRDCLANPHKNHGRLTWLFRTGRLRGHGHRLRINITDREMS